MLDFNDGFKTVSEDDWRGLIDASLKGRAFNSLKSKTADGIIIEPLYQGGGDVAGLPQAPKREVADKWTVSQRADMPELAPANTQILDDLNNGATGITLVLPYSVSAAGRGVMVDNDADLDRLLAGVAVDKISLNLDGGRFGPYVSQLVIKYFGRHNLDLSKANICFGIDPLGTLIMDGEGPDRATLIQNITEIFNTISTSDYHGVVMEADGRVYHRAGCTEVQELAFSLATAVEYIRFIEQGGVTVEDAFAGSGLVLSADGDQFLTIAKLRAARLLWARLQQVCDVAQSPLHLRVETASRMMSRRDPYTNLLRTTSATFAAGIGGADSITVLPFSHQLGVPDGFARRMARNIQSLVLEESHAGQVRDAAAGSGYVEQLSNQLAQAAWDMFRDIENNGGMLAAIEKDEIQPLVRKAVTTRNKDIARRKIPLTGISEFPNLDERPVKVLDMPVSQNWGADLVHLKTATSYDSLAAIILAAPFEELRQRGDEITERTGSRPQVYLATLGRPAEFNTRTSWMRNLLAAGGIKAVTGAVADYNGDISEVCLCSSDKIYAIEAKDAITDLRKSGASHIMVAGKAGAVGDAVEADEFIAAGQDILAVLERLCQASG